MALVENQLAISFPLELRDLLIKANGLTDEYNSDIIWSADEILTRNKFFRESEDFKELYMPFDSLLLFAEEVNGDLYAYVILEGIISRDDIFIWEHETDSRNWFAPNLKAYFERRLHQIL